MAVADLYEAVFKLGYHYRVKKHFHNSRSDFIRGEILMFTRYVRVDGAHWYVFKGDGPEKTWALPDDASPESAHEFFEEAADRKPYLWPYLFTMGRLYRATKDVGSVPPKHARIAAGDMLVFLRDGYVPYDGMYVYDFLDENGDVKLWSLYSNENPEAWRDCFEDTGPTPPASQSLKPGHEYRVKSSFASGRWQFYGGERLVFQSTAFVGGSFIFGTDNGTHKVWMAAENASADAWKQLFAELGPCAGRWPERGEIPVKPVVPGAKKPRRHRVAAIVTLLLFSIAPLLVARLAQFLAETLGYAFDGKGARPCAGQSVDTACLLHTLGSGEWLIYLTIPFALLMLLGRLRKR